MWMRVESSSDPLPPTDPPLCPLHDFGVGPLNGASINMKNNEQ